MLREKALSPNLFLSRIVAVYQIKPDSVVLEREGRRRELGLKQSSSPVKVRRSR